jgi:ferric-dicitrate binding protein FerR (iron transport regulator)
MGHTATQHRPRRSHARSATHHEDVVSTERAVRSGGPADAPAPRRPLTTVFDERPTRRPTRRAAAAGVVLALVVAAAAIVRAKWLPNEA